MQKVVELITFLNDAGAENLVKNYCLNIDRTKFDIVVVTIFDYNHDCNVYKSIAHSGIQILSVHGENIKTSKLASKFAKWGTKNPQSLRSRIWDRLFADRVQQVFERRFEKKIGRKLSKLLKEINPGIVHAHLHVNNYLRKTRLKNGVKLFYTCHSEPYRYFSGREYKNTAFLVKKSDMRLVALHEDMRNTIEDLFGISNVLVLKNWIDFSRFKNVSEPKEKLRESLNIPQNALAIGTVGRIVEYKNQIFLVDVLKDVIEKGNNAVLAIVGDGEESIKKQIIDRAKDHGIADKILFLGIRADVERFYKAIDVFALSSFFEGFAMVTLEAQVAGRKCLLSNKIPQHVVLTDKTFLLPLDNSKIWADYILDDSRRNAYFFNLEQYDISRGIKELEEVYGE